MAVEHIVLIELGEEITEEQAQTCLRAIAGLQGKVPGVLGVRVGKNFTDRAGRISHAAVMTMRDRDALAAYGPHPAHQEVVGLLREHGAKLLVVDIEV